MPALPRRVMNATVFLYQTEEEARSGSPSGASGFIVGVPALREEFKTRLGPTGWHLYAVTADHVIVEGAVVIRQTTREGDRPPLITTDEIFTPQDWKRHSVADLAIAPLGMKVCPPVHRRLMPWIEHGWLATDLHRDVMTYFGGATVGDEVFMVGRFSSVKDGPHNNPVARFGNIATLPLEMAHGDGAYLHPSYLVEMRSINMYSGSPVFTYVPERENLADTDREEALKHITFASAVNSLKGKPWVLGVDTGHIKEMAPGLFDDPHMGRNFKIKVSINSVMALVTPADYILEMLKMPDLKKQREQEEDDHANVCCGEQCGNGFRRRVGG